MKPGRAVEMTGAWKTRKTKSRFSFVSHSPWKSPGDFHIPTAPVKRGKVENQKQVSHFPTASISLSLKNKTARRVGFALRPRRRFSPASVVPFCSAVVGNFHSALDNWSRLLEK